MSPKAATEVVADSRIAAPIDRGGAAERAARVDAWQAVEATFAFGLASDNGDTGWLDRLTKAAGRIRELTVQDPDVALYMMLQKASNDVGRYGASHSMFCAVVADLCAAHFDWPPVEADALRNAALTMNVGMLAMQDAMAHQIERPSPAQKPVIAQHADRSVEVLKAAGVNDPLWLEVVRRHHRPVDDGEACDPPTPAQRLAQLLQRIDVFTAKLSRRRTRPGSNATVAARDACLDKSGFPDPTGATMLRVLGLYPPGSYVRLVNGEICVVVRRGEKAHTPFVACVRREDGAMLSQPVARDTASSRYAVRNSLSADEVKVRLDHRRALAART